MKAMVYRRIFVVAGALLGLSGVALSAAASHMAEPRMLASAASVAIGHGPALLALAALYDRLPAARIAGLFIVVGAFLFIGDMLLRSLAGTPIFPMAAPSGGLLMMGGWLIAAIGGAIGGFAEKQ